MTYLAKGSSGTVFIDPNDSTTVRKVFESARAYGREVGTLTKLHAHGIDDAIAIKGHDDRTKTVSLEYLPHTLEDLIVRRTLSPRQKKDILERLAWFLVQIHGTGTVHGDFKAKNVVVSGDMRTVKVVDYERSKRSDDDTDDVKKFKFMMVQMAFDLPYAKSYKGFAKYASRFDRAELLTMTDMLQIYEALSEARD